MIFLYLMIGCSPEISIIFSKLSWWKSNFIKSKASDTGLQGYSHKGWGSTTESAIEIAL